MQGNIETKRLLAAFQVIQLLAVGFMFGIWGFVEYFWPDFFSPFTVSRASDNILGSVFSFWPLLVYACVMAVLSAGSVTKFFQHASDEEHFAMDVVTSTLAGIWEELGFRCVFILTGMVGLFIMNYIWWWFVFILWFTLALALISVGVKAKNIILTPFCWLLLIGISILFWQTIGMTDPLYWIWQAIVFPVMNWISFGLLHPIIYHETAGFLFIAGAITANGKFRDGHKYQGVFGYFNSWIVGFILLFVMLYHGLLVAIIIHVIYDLFFAFVHYGARKLLRQNRTKFMFI